MGRTGDGALPFDRSGPAKAASKHDLIQSITLRVAASRLR